MVVVRDGGAFSNWKPSNYVTKSSTLRIETGLGGELSLKSGFSSKGKISLFPTFWLVIGSHPHDVPTCLMLLVTGPHHSRAAAGTMLLDLQKCEQFFSHSTQPRVFCHRKRQMQPYSLLGDFLGVAVVARSCSLLFF